MRLATTLAAAAAALVLPAVASAHVVFAPPFIQAGKEVLVSLQVPNERPPHATIEVATTGPAGIDIVFANAPAGWLATVQGNTATWRRGRIEGQESVSFRMRVVAEARAGTYAFSSKQRYEDGETVRWTSDLAVLPAARTAPPKEDHQSALIAVLAGVVVIGASLVGLLLLRRRSLQVR